MLSTTKSDMIGQGCEFGYQPYQKKKKIIIIIIIIIISSKVTFQSSLLTPQNYEFYALYMTFSVDFHIQHDWPSAVFQ